MSLSHADMQNITSYIGEDARTLKNVGMGLIKIADKIYSDIANNNNQH